MRLPRLLRKFFNLDRQLAQRDRLRARFRPGVEALEDRVVPSAALWTDKPDYHPGDIAVINGSGYAIGETVRMQVMSATQGPGQSPWYVADGSLNDLDGKADGHITTTWLCDPNGAYAGSTLIAAGIGVTSGQVATATFTDGNAASGEGTLSVSPATATTGSTGNSFTFTFHPPSGKDFSSGSQTTIVVPALWTVPQNTSSSLPGFITVTPLGGGTASLAGISGTTITVNMSTSANPDGFTLTYAGGGTKVTAPAVSGTYTFTTQTRFGSGGSFVNIASSPSVVVSPPIANQAPALANSSTITYTENAAATAINTVITVTAGDIVTIASASVSITANFNTLQDVLTFSTTGTSIIGSYNSGTGVVSFTGVDTPAHYQTVLRSVSYSNSSDAPTTGARTVSYVVNDGSLNSNTLNSTVNITAVNDAPVLNTAPSPALTGISQGNQTSTGDTVGAIVVDGSITDPDGSAVEAIAVITVDNTNGKWQYNTGSGFVDFSATTGSSVDLSAAARLLDTGNTIRFVPNVAYVGSATFTFRAWDKSTGTVGGTANLSGGGSTGGTTAFSTASDTASITVIDNTPPTVSSISRVGSTPTNALSVSWTVTFSESVTGVDSSDFSLISGGGVSGASITGVTGSGTTYTVTASTGSGNGSLGLNLTDNDSITDGAGNPLGGTGTGNGNFTGEVYTIDKTAPTVSSINRVGSTPTNASSVSWTVTFSESVTGVDSTDFALAVSGPTGTSITSVTGSGTTYTVTANTGSGDGTLGLNLVDDDTIVDGAGNKLGGTGTGNGNFTGQSYTIDKTAPAVSSIIRNGSSPTNASSVSWTVTFSESVTGVDSTDFVLAVSGPTGTSITSVTGSGTTYTVTANTGSGGGTLGLNLTDDDTIIDPAGNKLGGTGAGNGNFTGQVYTIDKTAPTVTSILRSGANPTNAPSVSWTVTFSESVTGVDTGDFTLAASGVSGASISSVTGGGTTYTVTASTGSGSGILGLNLVDNDSITDGVGNPLGGAGAGNGSFTGEVYTIDKTAPTVSSINRANSDPTNASSVSWTVTFSESVSGVDAGDFALAVSGVSGTSITSVTGSGTTYTVTANTGSGSGTLGLNLNDNDSITDGLGNPLGGTGAGNGDFVGQVYTIDRTAPTVTLINLGGTSPTNAASVTWTVIFSEIVTGVDSGDFTLVASGPTGTSITSVTGSGTTYTVTASTGSGNGTLGLNLVDNDSITDGVGNPLGGAGAGNGNFTGQVYTIDKTAPTVTSINLGSASPTNASSVTWTVTFSESVSGVDTGDFTLVASGPTGTSITSVTGSGTTYTVTANTGSGDGSLGLNLTDNDSITDPAGNPLGGAGTGNGNFTGQVYTIDKTAPTVSSINRANADPTNLGLVSWTVTFSESVTGVDTTDFVLAVSGPSGTFISTVTGSGTTYTVTASTGGGDGTLGLNLTDDDSITDPAGNKLGGAGAGNGNFTGQFYTIDKTAPTVSNVTSTTADGTYGVGAVIAVTVSFSESVAVTGTPILFLNSGGSASYTSGSGTSTLTFTYTVSSSQNSADLDYTSTGALSLNGGTIKDGANNNADLTLASPGAAGSLGANKNIVIDTTAATVTNVTSTTADGTYGVGAVIAVTVSFSESVTVTGTPILALNSGGTASYASGTGTSTLTFTYTVSSGQNSADLDYTSTGALSLNGGTIKDGANNNADLTLASPGAAGSLGANKNIVIDTTAATVTNVTSTTADGTYGVGAVIAVTVSFSESVTVTGTPILALNSGGTASYASGTGTSTLTFTYTVSSSQNSADLDYTSTGALSLNGGTIKDGANNNADLTLASPGAAGSLGANKNIVIDTTAATVTNVTSTTADGTYGVGAVIAVTVSFSESVNVTGTPTLTLNSGGSASYTSGSGSAILTFTYTVSSGENSADLDYTSTSALSGGTITDAANNSANLTLASPGAAGSLGANKDIVIATDTTAPTVSSITLGGASPTNAASVTWTVTFSEAVTGVDASDFTLVASGPTGTSITLVTGSGTTWTVTASTGTGDGTLGLNLTDDDSITDPAGNKLGGTGAGNGNFTGQVYTIDKTAPTVSSINRANADPTNLGLVSWTVTFSESVTGVDTTDFVLAVSGPTGTFISTVTGSGTTYTVTASTGGGDGTLGLNLTDDDSITDPAGNKLGGAGAGNGNVTGQVYTIDKTAPTVSSINRANADPTNASSVSWTVTFSESVSGVDSSDFALAVSGPTGASITLVTGGGTTYTVTASTGSGDGTLGLNLTDNDSITDAASNPLGGTGAGNGNFVGDVYTIDKTAPTVTSINRVGGSSTNAASVSWTVTFSESVTGVDAGDFVLAASGPAGTSISSVSGGGTTYTVTASTGTGDGSLGLNLVDNDTITDGTNTLAGASDGSFTGQVYTIDKTAPTVTSINRVGGSSTNAASVSWTVTFSESVSGVDAGDFVLAASGVSGASISGVSGGGTTWTVTASTGTGDGSLGLNLVDNDTITDGTNTLAGASDGSFTGQVYTIDKTDPTVTSINRVGANPTNAGSVSWTVTFSESVSGVDAGDFVLAASGVSGASISGVSGGGTTWTVTASTGTGDGSLGLNLVDNDTITDGTNTLAGASDGSFTGQVYTIDKTDPTVTSINRVGANPTNAGSVSWTVTFSESVSGVDAGDFVLAASGPAGTSISSVSGGGTTWTVTASTGTGDGSLGLNLVDNDTITDGTNTLAGASDGSFTGEVFTIDKTAPTVTSINRNGASTTNAASVSWTVTFSEAVSGVDAGDFVLAASGPAGTSISSVTGGGTTYTVTASTGTGDGSLGLNLVDNDTITDGTNTLAGASDGSFTGQVFTIDKTAPTVTSINRVGANPTNAGSVSWTVTFSESVSGVDAGDFVLAASGPAGTSISSVSGGGTTYTVTASTGTGDGSLGLNLVDNDTITDGTNTLAGASDGSFTGEVFTIDKTAPTVTSINRNGASTTNAASVSWTVTFSEAVTGVDAGDFVLAASGPAGTSISSVSGGGTTYTVTASTGTGDGSLGLNLVDNDTITDGTNTLAGASDGSFTGQVFTIDKTAPTVTSINRVGANPTNAGSVSWTVTFSEAVSGVDAGDFVLAASGPAGTSISSVSGGGTTYTVTASTGTGDGSLGLNLVDNDTITDGTNTLAGASDGSFTGQVFTIDKTAPTVTSINRVGANPTNAGSVSWTVTFSEAVSGVDAGDFVLAASGPAGTSISSVSGGGTTYTVTASTGTGDGSLGLNLVDNDTITDGTNTLAGASDGSFTGQVFTIDKTDPTVTSINRVGANPTNAGSVSWTVTFSESVSGVDAGDFVLAASGPAGTSISSVTGGGTTWTVTASTGTGDGTLGLNLVDNDTITDGTNTLAGASDGSFTGQVFTIDKTAPTVTSINRVGANPTNAGSVSWTVTFSESVSGVDAGDFVLAASGPAGTSISSVTGGGTTWTVTASTGTGDGSLGLNLVDNDTITDGTNTLAGASDGSFTGQVFTIDKTAPTVSSINRTGANPTNAGSVSWTVTFSESVTGVDAGDFVLAASGPAGTSISSVTGGGTTWTVTASTGTGDGSLGLNLVDNDTITDGTNTLAGASDGSFTGQVFTIDKTAPTVSSINRTGANPTNAGSVSWTVTFSESVTGVDAGDFVLAASGPAGTSISSVTGGGTTWTVTASTGTGDGSLGLNLVDNDTITDGTNTLAGASDGSFTGQVFTIDKTAPTVSSINRTGANPTNAGSVSWTVTFSESVTGVDAGDFVLAASGPAGTSISSVTGGGTTWTVTASTGTGDGSLGLNLVDNDTITDGTNTLAGASDGSFTGQVFTIDKTAPTVSSINRTGANPTNAGSVSWTVTFSESVSGVDAGDFVLAASGPAGTSISSVTGGGTTWTVTASTGTGDGSLGLNLVDNDTITDGTNTLAGASDGSFTGQVFTIDKTAPTVSSINRTGANPTNAGSVSWTVTFSESVSGVDAGDFVLAASGPAGTSISSVTGGGTTWTVTASTGTGDGSLGLNLVDNDTITDGTNTLAGASDGSFTGQVFTIDKTAPTVSSINRTGANPTNAGSVSWTVTFSESVTGVDAGDFVLAASGPAGTSISSVTGGGTTWTVTASTGTGDGSLGLNLVDNDTITDGTNTLAGASDGSFTGQVFTIDKTAPTVSSINRTGANPTNAGSVSWTVTFSESVTGVDAGDFVLAASGPAGTSISSVTGGGTTWTVTASTGTGDGSLGLNLVDNDTITDGTNTLAGASDGSFTGQVFTIDKTAPTVSSINRTGANPTNAGSVSWTVTFSESVTGVDAGDFVLAASGPAGTSISSVTGGGTTYTVTASTGTGDGSLGLNLTDNDSITDGASNPLGGAGAGNGNATGDVYTIDKTVPTVTSIVRTGASPTNASSVSWTVTFSESVTGVDSSDFALVAGGGVSGASISGVTGGGTTYTVTASTGTGSGTLGLNLVDNDTIVDGAGNTLAGAANGSLTGQVYTIDKTAPTVASVVRNDSDPTNASSVGWTITFSESVTGVDSSDFALVAGGGVSGASITGVTGGGTTYTVTASTGTGSGTLGLNISDNDSITDAAGNSLGGAGAGNGNFTGPIYNIDKTAPVVSSINRSGGNPTAASTVTWTVTFSEAVSGVGTGDFALVASGVSSATITSVTPASGPSATYTVTASTGTGDGTLGLNLVDDDSITDGAGNKLGGTGPTNGNFTGQVYTIDKTAPTVFSINRTGANPTNATSVSWTVTITESVTGVDLTDFALVPTGLSGYSLTSISGSGAVYTVTANPGTGSGTISLKLVDNDSIVDPAGNKLGGTGAGNGTFNGQAYTIDRNAPTVVSINYGMANPTAAASVTWFVTFSESVTGVDTGDFTLVSGGGVVGASITSVTGSGTTYTVTASRGSGDGTLGLNLTDNDTILDIAGNNLGGAGAGNGNFTGQVYTINSANPTILDIQVEWGTKKASLYSSANNILPWYHINAIDVVFSTDVIVDSGDIAIAGVNVASYGIASFSYSSITHTARWVLTSFVDVDKLTLSLDGDDATGDGHNGIRNAVSGAYLAGGDFTKTVRVLPGDVNGDNKVDATDLTLIRNAYSASVAYSAFFDINGDGVVDVNDYNLARTYQGRTAP